MEAQTTAGYVAPSGQGGTLDFRDIDNDGLDDVYDAVDDSAAIVNGSFDGSSASGWVVTGAGAFPAGNAFRFNAGGQPAGGTLSQTISTVPGETYTVSFEIFLNGGGTVSLDASAHEPTGAIIGTATSAETNSGARSSHALTFTAVGGQTEIRFTDTSTNAPSADLNLCLLYTSPSPRDRQKSRMPSSA